MGLRVSIDQRGLNRKQRSLLKFLKIDFLRAFKRFRVYLLRQTGLTFRALKHGGAYRGVTWPWYKPQYTRKTDGVTVPAEGGVHRVARARRHVASELLTRRKIYQVAKRVSGTVKGRLRPSGKRISRSSNLLRDTGRLAAAAGQRLSFQRGGKTMLLGTGVSYAEEQQARRPFLFFQLPEDQRVLREYFVEELAKALAERGPAAGEFPDIGGSGGGS